MQSTPIKSGTGVIVVALFAAFVAFAGLFSLPPLDRDEARFAQATAQMLETGDYITIRFQDRERNKKPAGIYWLQAASVSALSSVEAREIWAYRIPSLIGVVAAAVFTFLTAQLLYDTRTGFLAGLIIASAPVVAAEATIAKTDGVLLALICAAQFALAGAYRAYASPDGAARKPRALLFWIAQGAAILVKGPIAPTISALTGLALFVQRPGFLWIRSLRPLTGAAILIVMVAPWAVAIWLATDGRFFEEAIGGDMLGKVGDAQESHAGPPGYHFALMWLLFWPAAALLPAGAVHLWRDRSLWQAQFLTAWIIPAWLVFEIAATKLPHYVMPLYPALAIMAAHAAIRDGDTPTRMRRLGAIIFALVGLVAAAAVGALPIVLSAAPMKPLCFTAAGIIALLTALIATLFWRGRAFEGGVSAAGLAALYAWIVMTGVLPGLSTLALSPRLSTALDLAELHPLRDGARPVAMAGYSEPSAIFLIGTDTVITDGFDAAARLAKGEVGAAVIEDRFALGFMDGVRRFGLDVELVVRFEGLNYSNGDLVALAIYRPRETAAP